MCKRKINRCWTNSYIANPTGNSPGSYTLLLPLVVDERPDNGYSRSLPQAGFFLLRQYPVHCRPT